MKEDLRLYREGKLSPKDAYISYQENRRALADQRNLRDDSPVKLTPKQAEAVENLVLENRARAKNPVDISAESGIINTGAISGALNPYEKKAENHAIQYYESVRHMKTDTKRISTATGISQDKIDKIKNHVFIDEHDLSDGKHRFAPSYDMAHYDMAQSWQRLINGSFEEKDIVLLKHEYAELRYMEKGLSQDEAHIKASRKYNYAKYCE